MTKISSKLDIIIEISYLAIFLLCPIFFANFVYQPFPIGWQVSFYFLLEISLFFWLLKIIFNFPQFKKTLKARGKYILPFFIFLFFVFLSTLFSQSPEFSFWGSYERSFGLLTWLHLFLFYCLLLFNLKTKQQFIRLLAVILTTTIFVCSYGVLQLSGFMPSNWEEEPWETHRIFSTLGQPNFLGSWLLLVIPLNVWLVFYCFNFWYKEKKLLLFPFFALLILFLSLFVLIFTQSRGAWVGFIGQILATGIFFLYYFKKKKLLYLVILIIVFLGGLFLMNLNFDNLDNSVDEAPLVGRLKSLTSLGGASGRLRLIFWRDGLDLIFQRPFFGYGPEMQRFYYASYYQPEFAALEAINHYPDRAHNDIIDTLLTTGIFGFVSYLFFIGISFYWGWQKIKEKLDFYNLAIFALLIGIFGYLISIQFSFHVLPTAIYFIGFLSLLPKRGLSPESDG